jgi:rhodanese-related sulfurtransferase
MLPVALIAVIAIVAGLSVWLKAARGRRELDRHSITPEALRDLLKVNPQALLFDVRQPLDLLADSEVIPGARRVPPKEIQENAERVPRDREVVVYCTCASDRTALEITKRAHALKFFKIKFLKGGLEAWKQKGYPVEPYRETFHLDTAT